MRGKTIYLVRHGETKWNLESRLQGQLDSPLTPRGREQARRIGDLLRDLIDQPEQCSFVVSPLTRAVHTAEIICETLALNPNCLNTDNLLKEVCFGDWEGRTYDEIAGTDPESWRQFNDDRWNFTPPAGESYATAAQRARRWLADAADLSNPIVIAHGEVGKLLRGLYAGLRPEQMLVMDVPQDAIFRLSEGVVARFAA